MLGRKIRKLFSFFSSSPNTNLMPTANESQKKCLAFPYPSIFCDDITFEPMDFPVVIDIGLHIVDKKTLKNYARNPFTNIEMVLVPEHATPTQKIENLQTAKLERDNLKCKEEQAGPLDKQDVIRLNELSQEINQFYINEAQREIRNRLKQFLDSQKNINALYTELKKNEKELKQATETLKKEDVPSDFLLDMLLKQTNHYAENILSILIQLLSALEAFIEETSAPLSFDRTQEKSELDLTLEKPKQMKAKIEQKILKWQEMTINGERCKQNNKQNNHASALSANFPLLQFSLKKSLNSDREKLSTLPTNYGLLAALPDVLKNQISHGDSAKEIEFNTKCLPVI